MEYYCNKVKSIKTEKEHKKIELLNSLELARKQYNLPQANQISSQESVVTGELLFINFIHNIMLRRCPRENIMEGDCDKLCKDLYEAFLSKKWCLY